MPTKPLPTFDFARTFEAATFVVEIDDRGDDQRYAMLVSGWENLLDEVVKLMFRPGRHHNDLDAWAKAAREEVLDHIGAPDQWEWATTSDMWPYKTEWTVGHGQSYQRRVTILRLFQNQHERAVFLQAFPGGRRPGEADDDDEAGERSPFGTGRVMSIMRGRLPPPVDGN